MNNNEVEIEAKFYVKEMPFFENRLKSLGAVCTQSRVHEINLRFDFPDRSLSRDRRVLRLRKDNHSVLTYKGPADPTQPVSVRQEIEFEVDNFQTARHFLEALGYEVSVMYEKYRTIYKLDVVDVALDEMPYGNFIEIEGPDAASIQVAAAVLRLNWNTRCDDSYLSIFYRFCQKRGLKIENLSFQDLEGINISPDDLDLQFAD
jgi:adenylate cyclase, class 2